MTEFSANAAQRVANATRIVERSMRNPCPRRARWFRTRSGVFPEIHFELYEPLVPNLAGASALAYPRRWNTDLGDYVTNYTADTFSVYDAITPSRFRGRGYGDLASPDDFGSRGRAIYRHRRWEIEWLSPHATWILCQVNDTDYTGGDITVDNVVVTKPIKTALLMAAVTTVKNIHGWDPVDNNAIIQASWNDITIIPGYPAWDGVSMDCAT